MSVNDNFMGGALRHSENMDRIQRRFNSGGLSIEPLSPDTSPVLIAQMAKIQDGFSLATVTPPVARLTLELDITEKHMRELVAFSLAIKSTLVVESERKLQETEKELELARKEVSEAKNEAARANNKVSYYQNKSESYSGACAFTNSITFGR